ENPSGKETTVAAVVRMNIPENAKMSFFRKVVEQPKEARRIAGVAPPMPANAPPPKVTWEETTTLVPGFVYELRLDDGDILPPKDASLMTAKVLVKSQNGAWAEVILDGTVDPETLASTFKGQFFVRLGDRNSPSRAFVSQTGTVVDIKADDSAASRARDAWAMPALNVQGKDTVQATYVEPIAADGAKDMQRKVDLRIGADAEILVLNMQGNPLELLKPGMPFEVQVVDANGDLTPKRDTMKATLTSSCGDTLEVELLETDIHSGIFSALVNTVYGLTAEKNDKLEVPFEGAVKISYRDEETIVGAAADRAVELATRPMAESECLLLTKVYDTPQFEVETLVRLGESLYAVGAAKLATVKPEPGMARTNVELQESKRLLSRVIERFPTSEYVVESLYLTARILREEQKPDEAKALFERVIKEYPDSELVPQALYQLVNLYIDKGDLDNAVESAMQLVNLFPKNTLVADAFVLIATYYYNNLKDYYTAATIYHRVCERFPDNPSIDRIFYRTATAYYRAASTEKPEPYTDAAKVFLAFAETFKDHELVDDSLYWAANALMKVNNVKAAYKLLTRIVFEMPNTVDMYEQAVRLRNVIKETYPRIEEDN
ncbi:MAG TPA: tetratricopeptide repeat protein, partial [Armatimonadota bacterium]|nr:tetratricopeptide repeat protein [Armatimonadota bacterium]